MKDRNSFRLKQWIKSWSGPRVKPAVFPCQTDSMDLCGVGCAPANPPLEHFNARIFRLQTTDRLLIISRGHLSGQSRNKVDNTPPSPLIDVQKWTQHVHARTKKSEFSNSRTFRLNFPAQSALKPQYMSNGNSDDKF
jgi:hypothetical protein